MKISDKIKGGPEINNTSHLNFIKCKKASLSSGTV